MGKYVAYNIMYHKGKAVGRRYRTEVGRKGETKTALKKRTMRENRRWNRVAGKGKYRAKFASIGRVKR